ncbi:MAG TPA: alpha/beta hydrolase [Myxococcota bacterium]|nr:alpha/beta hydrolase [Myxococcota bacterium]
MELALHELRDSLTNDATARRGPSRAEPASAAGARSEPEANEVNRTPALLLLHGLGERTPRRVPADCAAWPGRVFGLDLTGHGDSSIPRGGGYTIEILMGDVDTALAHLGPTTLLGRGLGAYVALLAAGARPRLVHGAILSDGPGLAGGSARPGTPLIPMPDPGALTPPDPFALVELAVDVRPPDYASSFVRQATQLSELERPISICTLERPDWLRALLDEPGVQECELSDALAYYAQPARRRGA